MDWHALFLGLYPLLQMCLNQICGNKHKCLDPYSTCSRYLKFMRFKGAGICSRHPHTPAFWVKMLICTDHGRVKICTPKCSTEKVPKH